MNDQHDPYEHDHNYSCVLCKQHIEDCHCPQCELCDEKIMPWHFEADGTYCCDECRQEAEERRECQRAEDRREWAMYGDDFDSWYR